MELEYQYLLVLLPSDYFPYSNIQPEIIKDDKGYILYKNPPNRKSWSNVLFATQGIIISPALLIFSAHIPLALVVTGVITAGSITGSLFQPKGALLKMGPVLHTGLWGLLGISIAGIFIPEMHSIDLYGGVGLFTVYNMYDTHELIEEYEHGQVDHLSHSIDYSLNIINIFIRMLEILARVNNKD